MSKKGQAITFANTPRIFLLLIMIGVLLTAGMIAMSSMRDSNYRLVTLKKSFTSSNTSLVSFAYDSTVAKCTGVSITNVSGGTNINQVNFTLSSDCYATLKAGDRDSGKTFNATYTGYVKTSTTTVLDNGMSGGNNLSAQIPTVGTMLGVGLILVVVIGVFAFFAMRGQ